MKDKVQVLEFITVAAEFCGFVEQTSNLSRKQFIDRGQKIITLLYLKALLLPIYECEEDWYAEKYVTEHDWMLVQQRVSEKLGAMESYFDLTEPSMLEMGTTINVSTSECFADIFQDIRNFIEAYRVMSDDVDETSLMGLVADCRSNFEGYWGVRAVRLLSEMHLMQFGGVVDEDFD